MTGKVEWEDEGKKYKGRVRGRMQKGRIEKNGKIP